MRPVQRQEVFAVDIALQHQLPDFGVHRLGLGVLVGR